LCSRLNAPAQEANLPVLKRILETALYVENLDIACTFYRDVMGLPPITRDERLGSFDVAGCSILLLFRRGGTTNGVKPDGGNYIPPHDGSGEQHLAFEVENCELATWEDHLVNAGIKMLSKTEWTRGGRSLYFRDPDGHMIELVETPGTWSGH
jgi:catechol 2,3-dioxygenase-like lactoylglutathione lyase family enzyme